MDMENNFYRTKDKRYYTLDGIRGIAILNMILYHMVWDLVHLFGMKWTWYHSPGLLYGNRVFVGRLFSYPDSVMLWDESR